MMYSNDSLWHDNGYDHRFRYFQYNHHGGTFRYRIKTPLFPVKRGLSLGLSLKQGSEMIQILCS